MYVWCMIQYAYRIVCAFILCYLEGIGGGLRLVTRRYDLEVDGGRGAEDPWDAKQNEQRYGAFQLVQSGLLTIWRTIQNEK